MGLRVGPVGAERVLCSMPLLTPSGHSHTSS